MENKQKKTKIDWALVVLGILVIAVFIVSIYSDGKAKLREAKRVSFISEIEIPEVPDITTDRKTGVITAEEWKAYYPEIYASHALNANNVGSKDGVRHQYPEDNPQIQTLYDGMAFSFAYDEAIGHNATLEDIANTKRPHKLANCLTCKTPDLTALVNSQGKAVYAQAFEDVYAQVEEPVSCYNCHANTPGPVVIVSDYMKTAMGKEIDNKNVDAVNVACAQCHIEYYFDPATKATTAPYTSLANMNPDDILAFYNEIGFSDYTNKNTGVGQIKVQHPEFETYMGEGSVHKGQYNCADCHMGIEYDKDGNPYVDHEFTSPLDNEVLLKNNCSMCHVDLKAKVEVIQKYTTEYENKVADMLVEVNKKLATALEAGTIDEETASQVKQLDRDAQFYWDFVYVENSEGAHNSALDKQCLQKAEDLAKQALALL